MVKKKSIQTRLILIPILVVIIAFTFIGGFFSNLSKKQLLAQMKDDSAKITGQIIDRLDDNKNAINSLTELLDDKIYSSSAYIIANKANISNAYLKKVADSMALDEVNYFDANGKIVYSSIADYVGWVAPAGHPVETFLKGSADKASEDIRQDSESGNYKKYGYRRDSSGGFVQVGINANIVQEKFDEFSYQKLVEDLVAEEGIEYAIFVDNSYKAVANSNKEAIGEDLSNDQGVKDALAGNPYYAEYYDETTKTKVYDVVMPFDYNGKIVGAINIGLSMEPVYNAVQKSLMTVVISGLLVCALLILVLLSTSRYAVSSINKLAHAAQEIADGNLDLEVDVTSNDEIGDVAIAINNTVHRLKAYIDYIEEITAVLGDIANGKLSFELKQDYVGEFEQVKDALFDIRGTLSSTISEIKDVASNVTSSSMQLSTGSQILAQGTTEQAGAIEELSSTISDISSKIEENAKHTIKANESMIASGRKISESNSQMQDMVNSMNEINARSNEIGSIIKAIDDIAFQTNILALNAAVEAARSGAAGKGFAVVADEVRNLAAKSSEAAKNSALLIERSMKAVSEGTQLAHNAAANLNELYENSNEIVATIGNIAESSQEQATAVSQINTGLEQISAVVHTNAATAEESAASSRELSNQSELLKDLVEKFEI
ncbi:MAG: methyl-accepting chemotaxis protein [Proteocatella sp.]